MDHCSLLRHDLAVCILCFINLPLWLYLLWEFIDEQRRKGWGGFFLIVTGIIFLMLINCVGTIVARGMYLTNHMHLTELTETNISSVSHVLQEIMGVIMLLVGTVMVKMISDRRRKDRNGMK